MGKIIEFLQNIPDKLAHLLVCLVGSLLFGFAFGLGASMAAEYKDKVHGGQWSWPDFFIGVLGSAVGAFIQILIIREIWL